MFVRDLDLKDVVTFAGKEYLVSTVQLTTTVMTLDRLLFGISDIQRYETMIFAYNNGNLDYIDFYCERYNTKDEENLCYEFNMAEGEEFMKKNIHPEMHDVTVKCA